MFDIPKVVENAVGNAILNVIKDETPEEAAIIKDAVRANTALVLMAAKKWALKDLIAKYPKIGELLKTSAPPTPAPT